MIKKELLEYWQKLYPNFKVSDIACPCCNKLFDADEGNSSIVPQWWLDEMGLLQKLRTMYGKPMIINSAYRCEKKNKAVGGVEASQHRKLAFDVHCLKENQNNFMQLAEKVGFDGIGDYSNFVHIDKRGRKARWHGTY